MDEGGEAEGARARTCGLPSPPPPRHARAWSLTAQKAPNVGSSNPPDAGQNQLVEPLTSAGSEVHTVAASCSTRHKEQKKRTNGGEGGGECQLCLFCLF